MKKHLFYFNLLVCLPLGVFAQSVTVDELEERRSTGDGMFGNKCEIVLKVMGDEVRKYKFARLSVLKKAVDDQDIDLLKDDELSTSYKEIEESALIQIETKIPSRKALTIKELSGEITLYNPSEANGSLIRIADYQKKTNVNLLPPTVGLTLMYLTKESIEKYKAQQQAKKQEDLKKLPEAAREIATALVKAFDGFLSLDNDDPNVVAFFFDGDFNKLVDLYFEDAKGEKISSRMSARQGNLATYGFDEKPQPNWKLVLQIETSASVKKVPFTLTNITLP